MTGMEPGPNSHRALGADLWTPVSEPLGQAAFSTAALQAWRRDRCAVGLASVLCSVGCLVASLASTHYRWGAPSSSQDNQKCLHTLPGSPGAGVGGGGGDTLVENC